MRPSPGRTGSPDIGSGDIRYRVVGEGHGLAVGPGRIGAGGQAGLGLRVPHAQVPEDAFNNTGIVDECDDAHGAAAAGALERIDFVRRKGKCQCRGGHGWPGATTF